MSMLLSRVLQQYSRYIALNFLPHAQHPSQVEFSSKVWSVFYVDYTSMWGGRKKK